MRTTLNIDDDVAAMLKRWRKRRRASLKDIVNDALRRGLQEIEAQKTFRTQSFEAGPLLIDGIDNFADAIARAEGENFK
jgi:hypothetical protein